MLDDCENLECIMFALLLIQPKMRNIHILNHKNGLNWIFAM